MAWRWLSGSRSGAVWRRPSSHRAPGWSWWRDHGESERFGIQCAQKRRDRGSHRAVFEDAVQSQRGYTTGKKPFRSPTHSLDPISHHCFAGASKNHVINIRVNNNQVYWPSLWVNKVSLLYNLGKQTNYNLCVLLCVIQYSVTVV